MSKRQNKFNRKKDKSGKKNPKYVDLLEEDKALSGQKYVCISFVSPEKILKDKEKFMFSEYLKNFEFTKCLEKYTQFLNFISYKYNLNFEKLSDDLKDFVKSEQETLKETDINSDYKNFLDQHEEALEEEFNKSSDFQTSVRGIKVRGVFPTQQEAELRCKLLREVDPNFDVYVGPVGMWMPWEPDAYKTGRVEYLEEELNQLMHEKQKNESKAKDQFDKRVKDARREAIEKNIEKAKESGNKLTQNIDKDGNLVGIKNSTTTESIFDSQETVSSADIRKELFEGENVVLRDNKERVWNVDESEENSEADKSSDNIEVTQVSSETDEN